MCREPQSADRSSSWGKLTRVPLGDAISHGYVTQVLQDPFKLEFMQDLAGSNSVFQV